jgi:hypothetical protein
LGELDPERFVERRFFPGEMRLKFDCVDTRLCDRVDKGMGRAKRAVMRLRDFGNKEAPARPDAMAGNFKGIGQREDQPLLELTRFARRQIIAGFTRRSLPRS